MNALDKAFIKAYAKGMHPSHAPAVLEPEEIERERAAAATQNRAAAEVSRLSPLVEVSAADGVWYRIEPTAERPSPTPHVVPHVHAPNRVAPEIVRANLASNASAVDLLDSFLGLHTQEVAGVADPTTYVRVEGRHHREERPATERARRIPAYTPHEVEAFVQGAAHAVVECGWDSSPALWAFPSALCQCLLAAEVADAPRVIEQTWLAPEPPKAKAKAAPTLPSLETTSEFVLPASVMPCEHLSECAAPAPLLESPPAALAEVAPVSEPASKPAPVASLLGTPSSEPAPMPAAPVVEPVAQKKPASIASATAGAKATTVHTTVHTTKPGSPASPATERTKSKTASKPPEAKKPADPPKPTLAPPPKVETPAPKLAGVFQAAWEVDRFNWPEECDQLAHGDAFGPLAKTLVETSRGGKKVIAVTGTHRGEGRTTLSLCLARRAAQEGVRVALLDADFERPHLGRRIGIDIENGWDDVLTDGQSLTEAAVASLEDNLTVLPLGRRAAAIVSAHTVAALQQASAVFDLVLVDMGPVREDECDDAGADGPSAAVAIVACDRRHATEDDLSAALDRLAATGIETLGVIETFT